MFYPAGCRRDTRAGGKSEFKKGKAHTHTSEDIGSTAQIHCWQGWEPEGETKSNRGWAGLREQLQSTKHSWTDQTKQHRDINLYLWSTGSVLLYSLWFYQWCTCIRSSWIYIFNTHFCILFDHSSIHSFHSVISCDTEIQDWKVKAINIQVTAPILYYFIFFS